MATQVIYCPACQAANDGERERCIVCQTELAGDTSLTGEAPLLHRRYRQNQLPARQRWGRRKLVLTGLAAGGTLLVGGGLASYLLSSLSSTHPVWQGETSELIDVSQVSWSQDGRYLLAMGMDISGRPGVMLWDLQVQHYIWFHAFSDQPQGALSLQAAAWSPDGRKFALAEGTSFGIYALSSAGGEPSDSVTRAQLIYPDGSLEPMWGKRTLDPSGLSSVLWSPQGRYLAYVFSLTVNIWDRLTNQLLLNYADHTKDVSGSSSGLELYWSPDGQYIASFVSGSSSTTSLIRIWQVNNGTTLAILHTTQLDSSQDLATWIQWSPDSRYLIYGTRGAGFSMYDMRNKLLSQIRLEQQIPYPPQISVLLPFAAWSPDGKYLATFVSQKGQTFVEILQPTMSNLQVISSGQSIHSWQVAETVIGVSWSANAGRTLVTIGYNSATSSTLRFYDPATRTERSHATISGAISSLAWSPDGRLLAVWAHDDGTSRMKITVYSA